MLDTLTANRADAVRAAVKSVALRQLEQGGPAAVAINAIARELGVSGPALYRYFKNRDALLTALVLDAYNDLADALHTTSLEAFADSYRAWALQQPHRYRLLFAAPLPGYDAHAPELVAAAQRSMAKLTTLVDEERAVTLWARAHGHVSLEIEGNFASMGLDPEKLFGSVIQVG